MSLVARAFPGGIVPALAVLAVCCVALLFIGFVARLMLRRRRRAARLMRELVDPGTGLPSSARLTRDLRLLSRAGEDAGTHLLALLEPPGEGRGAEGEDSPPHEDTLHRLGQRLSNAVGRAGSAYALDDGRFGVLARVGRGSERAFLRAATAALSHHAKSEGAGSVATAAMTVSARTTTAREALHWLGGDHDDPSVTLLEDASGASQMPAQSAAGAELLASADTEPVSAVATAFATDTGATALATPD